MKVKPCPFCGTEAEIIESFVGGFYSPLCNNPECFMRIGTEYKWGSKESAVSAWNKRKKDPGLITWWNKYHDRKCLDYGQALIEAYDAIMAYMLEETDG